MKQKIENQTYGYERALYSTKNAEIKNCVFEGIEDGESALKECNGIDVASCIFRLRYPLWHVTDFTLNSCKMYDTARAALWYDKNGVIENCELGGIKALRECKDIKISNTTAVSPEFGWKCENIELKNTTVTAEYIFLDCKNIKAESFTLNGKYSFQYLENGVIENSNLNTKDAFWHSKNVTVKNSTVNGEYLGWYSENLTLINCRISGTQPLCYCKNLTLIDCTMENTDLSFENSTVNALVIGNIISVKNPIHGKIKADSIGNIILDENLPEDSDCEIITK